MYKDILPFVEMTFNSYYQKQTFYCNYYHKNTSEIEKPSMFGNKNIIIYSYYNKKPYEYCGKNLLPTQISKLPPKWPYNFSPNSIFQIKSNRKMFIKATTPIKRSYMTVNITKKKDHIASLRYLADDSLCSSFFCSFSSSCSPSK